MNVRDYQRQRYRGLDQALVNWREQRIVASLLATAQLRHGTLLDIPCGFGRFAPLFARLDIATTSADVDGNMVRLARSNRPSPDTGRWVHTNIFTLPFADNSFDCVFCVRLLHHRFSATERLQMLQELARVSRRCVLLSFYRSTLLHNLARHWRGIRGRLALLTTAQWQDLTHQSQLRVVQQRALFWGCHAQTFAVLTKEAGP